MISRTPKYTASIAEYTLGSDRRAKWVYTILKNISYNFFLKMPLEIRISGLVVKSVVALVNLPLPQFKVNPEEQQHIFQ